MSTEEKNKMIAEFMGIVYPKLDNVIVIDNVVIKEDDLQYHKSWNWLMPVVKKIRNVKWITERNIGDIHNALVDVNKEELHKAVVEFINKYNKNK